MLEATFRQLQAFAIVADTGSFAAAADRLGVSSAAVSGHIGALERKLNCGLFERRPGTTPVLTAKGASLLQEAQGLLERAAEMAGLAGAAAKPPASVRVGAGEFILERLFLPNIARFQIGHPELQIEFLRLAPGPQITEALRSGEMDLAYMALRRDDLEAPAEHVCATRQGLFASPSHPIVGLWRPGSGVRLPMIMPLAGSGVERAVKASLASAGVTDFDVVNRAQHFDTMLKLAIEGAGVCCLLCDDAADAVQSGRLAELGVDLPLLHRWALRRPGALGSEPVRLLDAFLTDLLRS